MTAYVALGRYDGFQQAASGMITVAEQIDPDPASVPVYKSLRRLFPKAYEQVSSIHASLGDIDIGDKRINPNKR